MKLSPDRQVAHALAQIAQGLRLIRAGEQTLRAVRRGAKVDKAPKVAVDSEAKRGL